MDIIIIMNSLFFFMFKNWQKMTHVYTMPSIGLIDNWSVDIQLDCAF